MATAAKNARTTMVVPCYNEEQRLPRQELLSFAAERPDLHFLLVNDGSRDGTEAVLRGLAAEAPARFSVLSLSPNGGKAEAVRQGFLHVLDGPSPPRFVGFWDADLATPLEAIDEFIQELEADAKVDMVLGSRVQLLGRRIERDRRRHYFGRVAATGVSLMLGMRVYDTQCGAKLFRVTPVLRGLFAEPFLTRWVFDVEILARWILQHRGAHTEDLESRVVELPLHEWRDVKGSRLKPGDFLKAPLELGRIWAHYFGPGASAP